MNKRLRFERDRRANLAVLHIYDATGRTEVRGKPGYEGDGYDAADPLHRLLDRIGKTANFAELMNGNEQTINPKHPRGPAAQRLVGRFARTT